MVDERNRLCRDILDKADGKFSADEKSVRKSTEKSHEWKQKGYLYEKHLMEVEATLEWLIKMKNGTATEADKPTFVSDIQDLLSSDAKQTQEQGGKSRLIQEKKPSFHIKDQFWSNSSKQRIQNKLNFYRDLERRRILDKNIKDYETAQLAEIAKKYGENLKSSSIKLKLHRDTVFGMTKSNIGETDKPKTKRGGKIGINCQNFEKPNSKKDSSWKTRTINKRKEKKRESKRWRGSKSPKRLVEEFNCIVCSQ